MKPISKLSLFAASLFLFYGTSQATFTDVPGTHENYQAITYLQENGTVEGYEDGSYRPDAEVNRAEALKIILLGSDILVPEIAEQDIFPDVLFDTWYAKYVAKAKNLGIVSGDDDTGMFRPGDTINLAEILKILLETNGVTLPTEFDRQPYADVPTDSWFAPYFGYADSIHLLPEDENFNVYPATLVTRGMMAQMMYDLSMKPEGYQEGEASYYGEKFHGATTASGEVFDASGFTAAHRTLPFGTWLKVRNFENDKEVYVRVNDRGPYAGANRIIDLSKAAFEAISPLSRGVINVSITPVSGPLGDAEPQVSAECPDLTSAETIGAGTFENISLSEGLSSHFLENEVLVVSGQSSSSNPDVSVFLAKDGGTQHAFRDRTDSDGSFEIPVYFPGPGQYQLGVLPGKSGSSVVADIQVLPRSCIAESTDVSLAGLNDIHLGVKAGDLVVEWLDGAELELSKVAFVQGNKRQEYLLYRDKVVPHYLDFEGWQDGTVIVEVQGADLTAPSILEDRSIIWGPKTSKAFQATLHHEYISSPDELGLITVPNTLTASTPLLIRVDPMVSVLAEGKVILPSGFVEDIPLTSSTHDPVVGPTGDEIYSDSVNDLRLGFTPSSDAIHFFEISDTDGLALLNIPVYPEGLYPLLPNPVDGLRLETEPLGSDLGALQSQMLQLVNQDRADHGLPSLDLDPSLSALAQARSDDMVENDYFSHYSLDGLSANDLRKDFAIAQYVSENLARDISLELAEYGLMRSASHRSNILDTEWQRVGFGFTEDPGNGIIFVQIFSDDPIDFSNISALRNEVLKKLNEARASDISLDSTLNNVSQVWSDKMVEEDFFDFMAPDSTTLVDNLRDAGISEALGTYIVGNSSFEAALEQISDNSQLKDSRWKKLGIGIAQDSFGIIKFTLSYTE